MKPMRNQTLLGADMNLAADIKPISASVKRNAKKVADESPWEPSSNYSDLLVKTALIHAKERKPKVQITSPQDVEALCEHMKYLDRELLLLICCNNRNQVVAVHEATIGALGQTIVEPRHIAKVALLCNASAIIVVHNHPSGSSYPSKDDFESAKRIKQSLTCVGLSILDFMIISEEGMFSFMNEGHMGRLG